jgi:CBS domain-containing protein
MKVRDIMTQDVRSCGPETNLAEAAAHFWEGDFGILPVVEPGGEVIGVVTDRDVCIAAGTKGNPVSEIRVSEVMAESPVTCTPWDDVEDALARMGAAKVRRLPVVDDDDRLLGMLSLNDIVLNATDSDTGAYGVSNAEIVKTLQSICGHRRLPVELAEAE